MDDEQLQKLIGAAIAYVSIHERSESEIRVYLAKRVQKLHLSTMLIEVALDRLKELKLVNDEAYARMFVTSRLRSRPKGEHLIRKELAKKGISDQYIDAVLHDAFHTNSDDTEYLLAKRVAEKKWEHWKKLPRLVQKNRLFGLLIRRGFSQTVVYTIIDEYTKNNYNTESVEGGEDAETPSA